jgi:hypothetical protein
MLERNPMSESSGIENDAAAAAAEDGVSAPGSEERRAILADAVADVNAGVAAETYDTDGENTEA